MLDELIASLTAEERETLVGRIHKSDSQTHKLIAALLQNPRAGREELSTTYGISSNTYFKNLSLAKEEIYDVIKFHMRNAYDDMILANVLYRRGLEVPASKLRLKLEAEYERFGWWSVLQELYNMELMVAYSKCDIKWLEKQKAKMFKNQERIHDYTIIDKDAIVQMAILEKGELKERDFPQFEKRIIALLNKARTLDHPIPLFNILHTSYVFYTRYSIDMKRAGEIIRETPKFLRKYNKRVIDYTKAVAWLNSVSFMVEFTSRHSPEPHFRQVEKAIGNHGLLFDAQAVLTFCTYHFLRKNQGRFDKQFVRFMDLPVDKSFQYKIAYLHCLKAYLKKDGREFNTHKNIFYTDVKNRAYNDYDLTIRYLEILLLLRENEKSLAADKLEAAVKFARRNFTTSRIKLEKEHWQMFTSAIHGKEAIAKSPHVYRLSDFILDELSAISAAH